jgi:hypothetical protein
MTIVSGGVDDPQVLALLDLHVTRTRAETARKRSGTGDLGTGISRDQLLGGVGRGYRFAKQSLAAGVKKPIGVGFLR